MEIRPILSTLRRHKLTASLLTLQVALTCAIVCNTVFVTSLRMARMNLPSGLAENELVMIDSTDLAPGANPLVRHQEDLAALRDIPGVKSAAAVDALPFNGNDWSNGIQTKPNEPPHLGASAFNGTPEELQTLGLHLVAGRGFLPDEYIPEDSAHGSTGIDHVSATIVTRSLAEQLFPGESAIGKTVYVGAGPTTIVGIVGHLLRPSLNQPDSVERSMLFPMLPDSSDVTYVLRAVPQDRERILKTASDVLKKLDANRVLQNAQTFTQLRDHYFQSDRTMIGLLLASMLGLLFVTALGITGLANFWVQQRTRSIGIRRAIGATRGDILRYFQTENSLIVGGGVVLGVALALGLNLLLMQHYELPRLPLYYLPIGAAALWLLGQLAVLAPALRAAAVPPVEATRSV
ncbi:MAG TPA: FtsX-like permease family protein [Gammaproteobacteria bacterium]|nr:FtsX-like permease family protein [Gammaproteobacteria bacterium]